MLWYQICFNYRLLIIKSITEIVRIRQQAKAPRLPTTDHRLLISNNKKRTFQSSFMTASRMHRGTWKGPLIAASSRTWQDSWVSIARGPETATNQDWNITVVILYSIIYFLQLLFSDQWSVISDQDAFGASVTGGCTVFGNGGKCTPITVHWSLITKAIAWTSLYGIIRPSGTFFREEGLVRKQPNAPWSLITDY